MSNEQPPSEGAAVEGLDPKIAGLLSYLLFGWIGGLIMYLTQKHPEVRFHAAQSILTTIALVAVSIALWIVGAVLAVIPVVGWLGGILVFLASVGVSVGGFVLWVVLCVKGYNLEHFKLPVVGDMAEQWAAK